MNVYFIRHGFSLANATHYGIVPDDHTKLIDCELTRTGILESIKHGHQLRKQIHNIDGVFCSTMMRAIQTAHHMFPKHTINIIPHIKEIENESSDTLMNPNTKLKVLHTKYKTMNLNSINLFSKERNSINFSKFKQILYNLFSKGYKNIAVVTHSLYMNTNLHMPFPNNNSVYHYYFSNGRLFQGPKLLNGYIPNKSTIKI